MSDYGPATYGDRIADYYDERHALPPPSPASIDFLASLAGRGPALELGIGTGRVALPLAVRGVAVHGIDASKKMVARLRAKKGGKRIPVTIGDFVDVPAKGTYPLIFVVFNTFFALLTQDDQVRCFEQVARRLAPGGTFVIEGFVPDPTRFVRGQSVDATNVGTDSFQLDLCKYDAMTQTVTTQHVSVHEGRMESFPVRIRFAWPSELDLMARIAGLRLRERWRNWERAPFTSASGAHVSVYEKPR